MVGGFGVGDESSSKVLDNLELFQAGWEYHNNAGCGQDMNENLITVLHSERVQSGNVV